MTLGEKQHVRATSSFLIVMCPFVFPIARTTMFIQLSVPHPLDSLTFVLAELRLGRLKVMLNRPVWEAEGSFQSSVQPLHLLWFNRTSFQSHNPSEFAFPFSGLRLSLPSRADGAAVPLLEGECGWLWAHCKM